MIKVLIVVAAVANSAAFPLVFRGHKIVSPSFKQLEFNGFTHLDMDAMKPATHFPQIDDMQHAIDQVYAEEKIELAKEQSAIRKVTNEFLQSDLHKEAISARYHPII